MAQAETRTVLVRIGGRVQGVWYRGWTVETAIALGLDGWVRNRADGSVEALFHGPAVAVARMLTACHQGPPAARVTRVDVSEDSDASAVAGSGFRQVGTL
ncbi:acylphosphatase [Roseospira visakhapatnamensis]|uniref:acylphosphatase n=1 Tax=Roseospira visakhapatnamensis TaxID=390880 RepID=A0A7W6RE54_9PROT|nr:acylphosphatase [Roseospira visakhapatnamensis]MBB4266263.1 acylphosphatase [Roseospira visakhapatnamensis]